MCRQWFKLEFWCVCVMVQGVSVMLVGWGSCGVVVVFGVFGVGMFVSFPVGGDSNWDICLVCAGPGCVLKGVGVGGVWV